jgi:hypothetical protein
MTLHYPGNTSRAGESYAAAGRPDSDDDYDDYGDDHDEVVYYEDSTRWRWVAAGAGAVLILAVIGTIVIVSGGDSASTTGRIAPSGSAPAVTPPVSSRQPPAATTTTTSPSPETVRTLTSSATTPTQAATAPPEADQPTIIYTVSGTRQPGDIVTVTYIDGSGAPRTDFNVTLPWTKTLPSAANMLLKSVTAVSLMSHLNCSISNGNGQTVATQNYNTIATTCNR